MLQKLAIAILCSLVSLEPEAARAGWTFCVAESSEGKEIWISSVFVAPRDRERLESEFSAYLKRHGTPRPVAQCPAAKDDKTEAVNDQTVAEEFHRKLGDVLHEVPAAEFEPKR
jgi:hypothetical protein